MALFPDETINEIRERIDIVRLIGEHLALRRAGGSFVGLCPFHEERSGSFYVHPDRRFFHCFGCGKSGDIFNFIQEIHGKSFPEAVRHLAESIGLRLPETSPERRGPARQVTEERDQILRLNQRCASWFVAQLKSDDGARARRYLVERGLSVATQELFQVGFAPAGWEALIRFLESESVPHELAEKAGLIRRREGVSLKPRQVPSRATHYDFLVDRVVYPLASVTGEVLGFGGRLLGDAGGDQPKYKNSPETPVYRKGAEIFALHLAKNAMRKQGFALVVEGNFDVMALHDHGFGYAVAPQGTALTQQQVRLLRRFVREVVIMFDGDAAGQAAMEKSLPLLLEAEMKVRVATLRSPDGSKVDPDVLVRKNPDYLKQLIANAPDGVEVCLQKAASTYGTSVSGKVQAVERSLPLLRAVADPLARDLYLEGFARLLAMNIGLLRRALKTGSADIGRAVTPEPAVAPSRSDGQARAIPATCIKLLALLGRSPELFAAVPADIFARLTDPEVREIFLLARQKGKFVPAEIATSAPPSIQSAVAVALLSEQFQGLEPAVCEKALADIIQSITLPESIGELELERQKALASGDFDRVRTMTAQILWLKKRGGSVDRNTPATPQKLLANSQGSVYETTRSNAKVEEKTKGLE